MADENATEGTEPRVDENATGANERQADEHATEVTERQVIAPATSRGSTDYVTPLVHVSLPSWFVDAGFWAGLTGAVLLGVVEPPVGVLLGAGVVVARHRMRTMHAA